MEESSKDSDVDNSEKMNNLIFQITKLTKDKFDF